VNFRRRIFLIIVIIIVLFSLSGRARPNSFIRQGIPGILKAPLRLSYSLLGSLKNIFSYHRLVKENTLLKQENITLRNTSLKNDELYFENERLRDLLDYKKSVKYKTIPAQVIGRSNQIASQTILIDKGARDGLKPDMPVASNLGIIGRIYQLSDNIARVLLLNDPASRLAVIDQRSRADGLLIGQGQGELKMILISEDADIKAGDKIITSGYSLIFPKGLLIGEVTEVIEKKNSLTKEAIIAPAINFDVEEVLCISYQPAVSP